MHHRPDQLSGGQQQRVAIARSFANDPSIILADEPTGNLDTKTGEMIIETLSTMSRQRGVTIISATHDHKMLSVSDRVVTIRDGHVDRIVLAGGCASIEGADEIIAEKTGSEVSIANPFAGMALSSRVRAQVLSNDAPSLMIACGLAMRELT